MLCAPSHRISSDSTARGAQSSMPLSCTTRSCMHRSIPFKAPASISPGASSCTPAQAFPCTQPEHMSPSKM
jgi:hypothetical protein